MKTIVRFNKILLIFTFNFSTKTKTLNKFYFYSKNEKFLLFISMISDDTEGGFSAEWAATAEQRVQNRQQEVRESAAGRVQNYQAINQTQQNNTLQEEEEERKFCI